MQEQLFRLLIDYSREAKERKFNNNTTWTSELKKSLAHMGTNLGYSVCTSGFKDDYEGEWLYDMVWYKEQLKEGINYLTEVPFVAEFEWNLHFNQIKYDFEKLLLANAELRLFVCYVHPDLMQHRIDYFVNAIRNYKHGNNKDKFLIAILDSSEHKFTFWSITKEECLSI